MLNTLIALLLKVLIAPLEKDKGYSMYVFLKTSSVN